MTPISNRAVRGLAALTLALAMAAAGCAGAPSPRAVAQVRDTANPTDRGQRTITNFTSALRCMDDLLFTLGTRDVSVMLEELRDSTGRVPVGVRDMVTSGVSEMTRRSRALRLSLFGSDQANLVQALQSAQRTSAFAVVPDFSIRGTVSQLDEDVRRQSGSLGLLAEGLFGFRFSKETRFSTLAFDAAVVRTDDFTLLPGVASKNMTVIVREDASAGDGLARLVTGNLVFGFAAARADGNAQAARNMIELALIELVGKLVRAPYWQCLGTPDDDAEVRREMDDWFESMERDERIVFLKERLRERRWFDGPLDASEDDGFGDALRRYRTAIGMPPDGAIDAAFFRRFVITKAPAGPLARPPRRVPAAAAPAPAAEATAATSPAAPPVVTAEPSGGPIENAAERPASSLELRTSRSADGRSLKLSVDARRGAYVYCYARNPSTGALHRIFPNRFDRDPRLQPGTQLTLPGRGRFRIPPDHELGCIDAPREVYAELPPALRWGDFEDIRLSGLEEIRQRFAEASQAQVGLAVAR